MVSSKDVRRMSVKMLTVQRMIIVENNKSVATRPTNVKMLNAVIISIVKTKRVVHTDVMVAKTFTNVKRLNV